MSKKIKDRVPVTDTMLQTLKDWQTRTGYGIGSIFKYAEKAGLLTQTRTLRPAAFNAIKRGHTVSVVKSDYDELIAAYESLPREFWQKQHALSRKKERAVVTPEFREQLTAFFESNTVGRASLFRAYGAPDDLRPETITRILHGSVETISKSHAEFLIRLLRAHNASASIE